jgi:hypothetical protein
MKEVSYLITSVHREVIICPNVCEKGSIKHIMSERSIIEGLRKSLIVIGVESENITCPNE